MTNPVEFIDDLHAKLARLERENALNANVMEALGKLDDMMGIGEYVISARPFHGIGGVRAGMTRETHHGFGDTIVEALVRLANPDRRAT